jgi:thioredoxin type arsenate reductase
MTTLLTPPAFFRIVAHEVRWQIITILAQSDRRVQELVAAIDQPQNFVSYHLKQLRQSQLVTEHRSAADGRDIYYSLDLERLGAQYHAAGVALHPAFTLPTMSPAPLSQTPNVLFVCTHNSARSQMAEGFLRQFSQDQIHVLSAGTEPTTIHPFAIQAMAELGVDITHQWSKPLAHIDDSAYALVITVCDRAREHCTTLPTGVNAIHWSIPDPVTVTGDPEQQLAVFRAVAQQLATRVRYLLATFATAAA